MIVALIKTILIHIEGARHLLCNTLNINHKKGKRTCCCDLSTGKHVVAGVNVDR
jgi:hypothetical protein